MNLSLIIDLHKPHPRLGPGSRADTLRAIELAGLRERRDLEIADLGYGTGASALVLAETLDAHITAVDLFPDFLDELTRRATERGLDGLITPLEASIDALPFEPESLDAIWSEGAIYNLGFEGGLKAWRPFLKPGGILAVSEITWLTAESPETTLAASPRPPLTPRPSEIQEYWQNAYPEIDPASAKIAQLEAQGFTPIGYFPLPPSSWLDAYYRPLQADFDAFLQRHNHSDDARACVAEHQHEIELYERYQAYYSYGFYIARKV
ncbi:class I SAM-dependent methyltransferase [Bradymonadaceae bacterium TMQ3]|nr:class I SAM-dependent methyltransferase [Bradymonadaceae bacterium TMQ3]TXC74702.1 class I SAM-dependent methyltransferase [Bradymonadales bacterium TMQ1]